MSEESPGQESGKPKLGSLGRSLISILIGLVITLIVGAVAERVASREWLEDAQRAQGEWIEALHATSPLQVGELYWTELQSALTGDTSNGGWSGAGSTNGRGLLQSPFWALAVTGARLWHSAGIVSLIQLAMGALAFFVLNFWRSKGETIFLGEGWLTMLAAPPAIVLLASVLGWMLFEIMNLALFSLSELTGLAATAAGATGILGFCWLCVTELAKKGAEHALTPKIKG